jgi:hypothetical protein
MLEKALPAIPPEKTDKKLVGTRLDSGQPE